MTLDSYPFYFIKYDYPPGDVVRRKLLYRFRSTKSNYVYIVEVEQYEYDMYAVKFYPKQFRLSKHKYCLLTKTFEARKVINSCVMIMLDVYNKNSRASFGFVGARSLDEKQSENVKRFRVYSKLMATYFSDTYFVHRENRKNNVYVMINRLNLSDNPGLIEELEKYFNDHYEFNNEDE